MAQQPEWGTNAINICKTLIAAMQAAEGLLDQMAGDSTLAAGYLAAAGSRTDLVAADFTNMNSALTQMKFTFDSGTPTQKSYLYKMT